MGALFDFPNESQPIGKPRSCEEGVVAMMVCLTSFSMIAMVAICLIIAGRVAMFLHSRHESSYLNSRDPS